VGSARTCARSATPPNVLCNGGTTGSVNVCVSGGTAPYSVVLGGVTKTIASSGGCANFTGLAAGPYTASITDANGCTTSAPATVGQPTALSPSATPTNATCNGASDGSVNVCLS